MEGRLWQRQSQPDKRAGAAVPDSRIPAPSPSRGGHVGLRHWFWTQPRKSPFDTSTPWSGACVRANQRISSHTWTLLNGGLSNTRTPRSGRPGSGMARSASVASRIHALPRGRDDLEGLPDEDGPRPDLNRVHFEADLDSARPGRPGQLTATLAAGRDGSGPFHRSLRYQLVLGDGLAASAAWVFAAVVAGDKGGTRQLVCALAAVVATMTALRRAGLYRTHVCNLPSRQVVRVVASGDARGSGVPALWLVGWLCCRCDSGGGIGDERRLDPDGPLALRTVVEGETVCWSASAQVTLDRHQRGCHFHLEHAERGAGGSAIASWV